jgi:hypothetical protein
MELIGKFMVVVVAIECADAFADIASCAQVAGTATSACRMTTLQAKANADSVAKKENPNVYQNIEPNSGIMIQSTSNISQIYQTAEKFCKDAIAKCKAACPGEGAIFASGCESKIGEYLSILTTGQNKNDDGTQKGTNTQNRSIASEPK